MIKTVQSNVLLQTITALFAVTITVGVECLAIVIAHAI
ncbi:hypothetical protein BH09PAT1_BH09PAT1_3330 [soil metagenome]